LSTASSSACLRAIAAMPAMSANFIVGLPGVSIRMMRVCGLTAPSTASRSEESTDVLEMPSPLRTSLNSRTVPPYTTSGDDHMVATLNRREKQGCNRGHARAEADRLGSAFERTDGLLERVHRRVRTSRVAVAFGDADFLLRKCGRLKNGIDHGLGMRVGYTTAVDGQSGNLELFVVRQLDLPQLERDWLGDFFAAAVADPQAAAP